MNIVNKKASLFFWSGVLLYIVSFFIPAVQFSLGIKLNGFEATILHLFEFGFVTNTKEYITYLSSALAHFWIIGLIIGYFTYSKKWIFRLLSVLAITSSTYWLFALEETSVLLMGYYLWLTSIVLIIVGRYKKMRFCKLVVEE